MRFPSLETLVVCALVGATLLALVGNLAQHAGYAVLLAFCIMILLGIFRYGFGTFNLDRSNPLGNVVGLVMIGTGAAIIVVWIGWTGDSEKLLLLDQAWGLVIGFAGGLVIMPGLAHETLRRRIGPGASLPLLVTVLYSDDAELKRQAAAGVATYDLPAANEAVPPLLLAAESSVVPDQLHAHAALASLGVPQGDTEAVLERELKAAHFRAHDSPLAKYPRGTVEFLRRRLHDKSAFVQRRACEALAAMGPAAESARAELTSLLAGHDRNVRHAAERALAGLRGPSIVKLLLRQWPKALFISIVALAVYGCSYTPVGRLNGYCLARDFGGEQADRLLVTALGDNSSDVYWMAQKALRKRGKAAVPALEAGLKSESAEVRDRCETLLGELAQQP